VEVDHLGKRVQLSMTLRRRRSFHNIAIGIAVIVMIAGLSLIAAAMLRLDLLERFRGNDLAIALGCALVAVGVLSVASYGLVRAIEWVSRR
jgi:hypothetical protein